MKDRCAYICVYYFKFEVPDCRERLITTFKIIMSLVCDLKKNHNPDSESFNGLSVLGALMKLKNSFNVPCAIRLGIYVFT